MTVFIGEKVRNLTVKFRKYYFSPLGYMRKLETAKGLIGTLALILAVASSAAEYYTWVDESGVVNYSERQPQGFSADHITGSQRFGYQRNVPDPAPDPNRTSENEQAPAGAMDDAAIEAQIAGERARFDQEIAAAKKSNCAIGKRNLAQLEAYARIRVRDDDGTERVLDDSEKSERIDKARQTIRENCTG